MSLKMNLRNGVASLAQFTGIGRGQAPVAAKPKRVQPFVGIGGKPKPKANGVRAENGGDADDAMNDDDGDDDEALDDDDYGADAPDDGDSADEAEAKRARRVARRARRMKAEDEDGGKPPVQDPKDAPPPDDSADDGDDSDAEMTGKSPLAMARRRERARCAAIFAHPSAVQNLNLAAHLAFNTSMSRNEAIGALRTAPTAQGGELSRVMADYAGQRPGAPPAAEKPKARQIAESWDQPFAEAAASRNGRKK